MADEETPWKTPKDMSEFEEFLRTKASAQDVILVYTWTTIMKLYEAEYDKDIFKETILNLFNLIKGEGERSIIRRLEKSGFRELTKDEQKAGLMILYGDNTREQIKMLNRLTQLGRLLKEREDGRSTGNDEHSVEDS